MKKTSLLFSLIIASLTFFLSPTWSAVIIDDVNLEMDNGNCCFDYEIENQTLNLSFWGWMASGFQIDGNNNVTGLVDAIGSQDLFSMEEGETIYSDLSFVPPSDFSPAYHSELWGGTIMNEGETRFFGFKVISGTDHYLGWLSVTRTANGARINQIAYENTTGTNITTGSTNSISQTSKTKDAELSIYPNPSSNSMAINTGNFNGTAALYNSNGELVKSFTNTEISNSIDVSDLPSGIYLLKYREQTARFVKR